jgi:hypothetical protein
LTPATAFSLAVDLLEPGATGRDIVVLLDGRANRTTALHWRSGRRSPPRWAIELLTDKIQSRALEHLAAVDALRHARERPGLKAGARNLAEWRVKNSACNQA